jgi:hypothetical protein
MAKAYVLNLVGEKAIKLAAGAGYVKEGRVADVSGVPHAQVLVMTE